MYRLSEKYSGKDKIEMVTELKKKETRNKYRKRMHPVTRELDNYYNCDEHKKAWFPNGVYQVKKGYYYAKPGLGHYYEKNNIGELENLMELQEKKVKGQKNNFIDFSYMEENQFIVTIEYCSNCQEHSVFTSHNAELYKNYALSLQKCILLRFPFISVLLKPIETDIQVKFNNLKEKEEKVKKNKINALFKDVRLGAFEVQLCYKVKKNKEDKNPKEVIILLHSKLETKKWPKIETILDKIVQYMPRFMGRIILYEKETEEEKHEDDNAIMNEGEAKIQDEDIVAQESIEPNQNQNKKNEKDQNFKKELIEGINVNIYLQKNKLITDISENSWETILKDHNPLKRRIMDREKIIKEKMEMYKSGMKQTSVIENKKFNRSRPSSAYSHRQNYSSVNKTTRPSSSKNKISVYTENDYITSGVNPMEDYLIFDKEVSNKLKGELIISKYTNSEGYIDIGPLPYDSYYIEVAQSKQYRSIGMNLVFKKLETKTNNYIKRFIGLYTQENSFIQLHVFETKKDGENKDDPIHIDNATVTIESVRGENKEDYLEDKEWKFEIKQKPKSPGIFEQVVPPGKYLLKIQKESYETTTKTVYLEKGLNCINIELFKERYCKLVIKAYNYEKLDEEKYSPVQNADVVIYQSAREILEQGITDTKGEIEYIVDKGEDFLTIVINKMGYFPIQRTFIRDKNMIINDEDQYYEEMSFFMVKKSYIYNSKSILFTIYSNIKKNNFSIDSIEVLNNNNKQKYKITSIWDFQEKDGMLSLGISSIDEDYENTQTLNNYDTQNNENNDENNNGNNDENNNGNNIENNNGNNIENNNGNNEQMNNFEEQENQNVNQENGEGNDQVNNMNTETDENNNINDNQEQNAESEKKENFDNIMNFTLTINTDELLVYNYQDKGHIMNGLERYGCQIIIYTPKNTFYISSPIYCKEGYRFWNVGWLDFKNELFYQTNTLIEVQNERVQYLSLWIDFLQVLINKQIYNKLFDYFGFGGSSLINKDRFIYEPLLKKILKEMNFCDENDNETLQFICDLFKSNNNMISYNLLKKKISSNLKNFSDNIGNENSSASFGYNTNEGFANETNNQV